MNVILTTINQIIMFLLEITMLITFGYYGLSQPWNLLPRLSYAAALIIITIFLWAVFAAPRSDYRLKMPYLAIFRATLFLVASYLLFQTGHKNAALLLAALSIITQTFSLFSERSKSE